MSTTVIRPLLKTGRASGNVIMQDCQQPAYAATLAITLNANMEDTLIIPGTLTGAMTINIDVTNPIIGDKARFYFVANSSNQTVTFGTGFANTGAYITVLALGYGFAYFQYNGTSWQPVSITSGTTSGFSDIQTPAYAATLSVTTTQRSTKLIPAQLTGAMTINTVTTSAIAGDTMEMIFGADGTNRTITFGTGLKSSGTLTVTAAKFAGIRFMYDGTEWIATGREITA